MVAISVRGLRRRLVLGAPLLLDAPVLLPPRLARGDAEVRAALRDRLVNADADG